jgi:hypothetical protein
VIGTGLNVGVEEKKNYYGAETSRIARRMSASLLGIARWSDADPEKTTRRDTPPRDISM